MTCVCNLCKKSVEMVKNKYEFYGTFIATSQKQVSTDRIYHWDTWVSNIKICISQRWICIANIYKELRLTEKVRHVLFIIQRNLRDVMQLPWLLRSVKVTIFKNDLQFPLMKSKYKDICLNCSLTNPPRNSTWDTVLQYWPRNSHWHLLIVKHAWLKTLVVKCNDHFHLTPLPTQHLCLVLHKFFYYQLISYLAELSRADIKAIIPLCKGSICPLVK